MRNRALRKLFRLWQKLHGAVAVRRVAAVGGRVGPRFVSRGPVRLDLEAGCSVSIGADVVVGEGVRIRVSSEGSLTIEDNVRIEDGCRLECAGDLMIGQGAVLVDGVIIYCCGKITIGAQSMIAAYVVMADADHGTTRVDVPMLAQGLTTPDPITLGPDVWLGSKVTVTKGVTIGQGAVVGANAVVTKDVPPYAVAVGLPARVIRTRGGEPETKL